MAQPSASSGNLIRNWLTVAVTPILLGGFVAVIVCCQAAARQRNERVRDHVAEVKTGMTEAEVRELIGKPNRVKTGQTDIIDTAVASTTRTPPTSDKTAWGYRYSTGSNGWGRTTWKTSTVYFKDGRVTLTSGELGW